MCFIAFLLELGNPFSSMAIREMNILADVGGGGGGRGRKTIAR